MRRIPTSPASSLPTARPAAELRVVPGRSAEGPASAANERDRALVAGILRGSRRDFETLYETHFSRVYRFALKRLGDPAEAEDVAQEVFETVFRVLPSYRGESSLLVWIFGITRNKVNRRFRGHRPRLESLDEAAVDTVPSDEADPDRALEARRLLDQCSEAIADDLTPLQRRIFHLKHLRRQPVRVIARALGKSEDAVKANLYRMRRTLADAAPELEGFLGS